MRRTGLAVAVVALVVVSTATVAVGVSTLAVATDGDAVVAQQTTATPTNNTTVQHERPDSVSQSGDSQRVSQWLEGRLSEQLQGSAIEISEGEYEQGQELLGDEYDSRLEQYVDVAGETEGTDDDDSAETFRETQQNQREFGETVQSYRETKDEYDEARANGNETRARAAARRLESLSENATILNRSLNRNYRTIANQTGRNFDQSEEAVETTTRNITSQQATVREQTFVTTQLTVETNGTRVAFDAPLGISGRVTTANGTAVGNQPARIVVFDRTYSIETDNEGRFEVAYRPVSLPVNASEVAVQFRPAATSPYLGSKQNVSVDVRQVTPTLAVSASPAEAGYGETVTTTATATVGNRSVPSLPLTATFGGATRTRMTNASGRIGTDHRVPAAVSTGDQSISVRHGLANRAVGAITETATVSVTSTPTRLSVAAERVGGRLEIEGRLRTESGTRIPDQSVSVAVGESVQTVETNESGWYRTSVRNVTGTADENASTVPVTARFDATGGNLQSSRAETTIAVPGSASTGLLPWSETVSLAIGGGVVSLVLLAGAVVWVRRDDGVETSEETAVTPESSDDRLGGPTPQQWIDDAETTLVAGDHKGAAIATYAAVRAGLGQRIDLSDTLTHTEFLAVCGTEIDDIDIEALSTVVDAYERATFAGSIEPSEVRTALRAAKRVVGE
ncbi:hypothetical protein [Natronomonas gomsonensis]|uniref:hypothetical protein n=1 Tax=Natronomonas gomsonensis TaxID=1046043 RepID=UPI0015BC21A8|nr:hypothetical protein [Natronomonas gomsonensis]